MSSKQEPHISTQETGRGAFVFFSYARGDKWLRDELEKHLSNLKYRGLITTWHDREIQAGEEWAQQIDISLNKAHIILLLISADFMASEYCYGKEMKHALERHEQREVDVIPILLRPVLFTDAPFAKLQMLPTDGKPITEWQNRDSAFVNVAYGIERVAKKYSLNLPSIALHDLTRSSPIPVTPMRLENTISNLVDPPQKPANMPKIIRRSLFSRFPISIFVVGLVVTGILALAMHSNAILLAIVFGLSLLAAGSVAALKAIRFLRAGHKTIHGLHLRRVDLQAKREIDKTFIDELTKILASIEELQKQKYYEGTVEAYRHALLRHPSDGDAFRGMGNALYALEHYDEAVHAFQQAVKYNPAASAYAGLTDVFAKLQRYDEAIATYEKAIEIDPTVTFNYDDLIQSLLALGRKEEAEQAHARAKQFGYY